MFGTRITGFVKRKAGVTGQSQKNVFLFGGQILREMSHGNIIRQTKKDEKAKVKANNNVREK